MFKPQRESCGILRVQSLAQSPLDLAQELRFLVCHGVQSYRLKPRIRDSTVSLPQRTDPGDKINLSFVSLLFADKKRRILLQPTEGRHSAWERDYTLTRCSLGVLWPSSSWDLGPCSSPNKLACLASEPLRSACLCLCSGRSPGTCHHAWSFFAASELQLKHFLN